MPITLLEISIYIVIVMLLVAGYVTHKYNQNSNHFKRLKDAHDLLCTNFERLSHQVFETTDTGQTLQKKHYFYLRGYDEGIKTITDIISKGITQKVQIDDELQDLCSKQSEYLKTQVNPQDSDTYSIESGRLAAYCDASTYLIQQLTTPN